MSIWWHHRENTKTVISNMQKLFIFQANMFPLRQKAIKCVVNELEGDDSDLMLQAVNF